MAKTYININGEVHDTASLNLPRSREFRDAWQLNKAVVEININKAKEIRLEQLANEAKVEAEKAEKDELEFALHGDIVRQEEAKVRKDRLRGAPKQEGINFIANASKPEELATLKVYDLF